MKKTISILLIFCWGVLLSQQNLNNLLDSLAIVKKDTEIMNLSLRVAEQLKYEDWKRTEHYINLAKSKAEESDSSQLLAEFYRTTAEIYYDVEIFDMAIEYNLLAYEYFEDKSGNEKFQIENSLAIIYSLLRNKERSLYHFKRIYEHYKKNNQKELPIILNNIGTLYLNNEEIDSALIYLEKSRKLLAENPNKDLMPFVLTNIARSYAYLDKKDLAEKYFYQAINDLPKDDSETRNYVYSIVAEYHLNSGDAKLAVDYALKAKEQDVVYYGFSNLKVFQVLYKAYLELGNFEESARYFKEYDRIRDNLDIEKKAVNVEKQRIEQDFKNKEEILELQDQKKRANLFIIILLLLVALLALALFLFRYRTRFTKLNLENELTRSQKRELELSLELKNKELTSKAMLEAERSEFFTSVQEDITAIQNLSDKDSVMAALNTLNKKIGYKSGESVWEDFEMSFINVYDSFYENLMKKHPDLSVFDKRICALIKLNLSTKEISNLTKSSVKAVENMRTRLRKKLGLTNQKTELSVYLSQF